ncbi:Uncharacterised protein [Yersinia frederiksenii]|uniref:Uncharacterized protein n=2 Tax=Yersinia frederiksenii TaxID=29484 RepID=A0A380PNJ5_YERFR|nr:hypothetical protein DJ58_2774 [Yersinia frederiksenii ATCC 33641]CNF15171.1 Uncharacterised protein [Yersinia frederiksenii]SUP75194.1 Uncharacterised protein [Yersinia frederiksenii]
MWRNLITLLSLVTKYDLIITINTVFQLMLLLHTMIPHKIPIHQNEVK